MHDGPVVKALDEELGDMYSSYYEFNSHDRACWFDEERERRDKPRTRGGRAIGQLRNHLVDAGISEVVAVAACRPNRECGDDFVRGRR